MNDFTFANVWVLENHVLKAIQFDDLGKELSLEWIINRINSNSKCLSKALKIWICFSSKISLLGINPKGKVFRDP